MKKPRIKVEIIESERGWGQKVDSVKQFSTLKLAQKFVEKFNSKNNENIVPDWYMYARIVGNYGNAA